ncbi:MAG TPA: hypothetical protein VFW90_00240 [Candidatus Saccharimonadales bacterium]|nr:hypothetical protein [Candidatus Saccharimonadales bacterium]
MVKKEVRPSATVGEIKSGKSRSNGVILVIAALDMSWRLALVVLVPIIAGFELDKHLGIGPALTITGFLIAMVGVYVILKSTVDSINRRFKPKENRQ